MGPTDEQLMIDLRGGSQEAFETLFERHKAAVWRFFSRRVREPARADELLQDVFLAVLQNAPRYEPRAAFRSYLFGIAFNVLKADRRRHAHVGPDAVPDDVAGRPANLEGTIWVRRALASLEPDEREIVMLREYEGLSYQEIAALLGVPLNTVRSRLFRARMDLKHALAPQSPIALKVGHENR
jgi:RNA polymerase sigma-70 factor (ECF subfamily)